MLFRRVSALGLLLALGLGTAACTEDGYGYSGISLGYGSPGYYDYAYSPSYYGWYGDYYYPGSGYYVYDRGRRPHRWNEGQRRYWETRRNAWRGDRRWGRENWGDFGRDRRGAYRRPDGGRPDYRGDGRRGRPDFGRDQRRPDWNGQRRGSPRFRRD
ncbi:hypothetical protein ACMGDH_13975 [Sphingomonas sp. DT-207]|uniref:hypothetical protein n=1 Tax=Sphingomonas sp. DT-207 TaxID=3396167 RepID=UPI003F1A64C2